MNYASSKQKHQISSYLIKQITKPKLSISKKSTTSFIQNDKDSSKTSLNSFRKNISKEKQIPSKYKTSKNSPNHTFKSPDINNNYCELLSDKSTKKKYYNKDTSPNTHIKDVIYSNNVDNLFSKKMQKIHTKVTSYNNINQLAHTHNNIFLYNNNNNSTNKSKIHLDTSLLNKTQIKSYNNINLTKKNNSSIEMFDEKANQNGIAKYSSNVLDNSGLFHIDKNAKYSDMKQINFNKKNINKIGISLNNNNTPNSNDNSPKYYQFHKYKSANVSKHKTKQKIVSSNISTSSNINYFLPKKTQQLLGKFKSGNDSNISPSHNIKSQDSNLLIQYNKLISSSNPNIKFDFSKLNKTSYTTNNSRKNSSEKKNFYSNNNNNNKNINFDDLNNKFQNINTKHISLEKNKQLPLTALIKTKGQNSTSYTNLHINNYLINNSNSSLNNINLSSNSNNISGLQNGLHSSNAFQKKTMPNFNNKKNDIKYIEYVTSGMLGNYSTKNSNSFINGNNNMIKNNNVNSNKKDKEYLYTKVQSLYKHKSSFTPNQSKHNSKSSSHFDEFSTSNNNINVNKQNEYVSKANLIKQNNKTPLTAYHSPLGKSTQNILYKKNSFKNIFDLSDNNNNNNQPPKKQYMQKEINNFLSKKEDDQEKNDNRNNIDNILNNTINKSYESAQSTIRESMYYKKEKEKISQHIKQYYTLNNEYPKTKIHFYKYGRVVGKGAFGKVNLALHVCSGKLVAIKSFNKKNLKSKNSIQKIHYEIEIQKKLKHPFITQILDTFETDTHLFIVMEYICGDLASFIRKRSKISEPCAKVIFKQIIEGLKYIHQNKIVHRDIKPDNILIDLHNTVKIADFGVSRKVSSGDIMKDHCGTPAYIAPEIFLNKGYEGFSCDIWSAGVTLYYLLGGVQPFKGKDLSELKKKIKIGKYTKLEKISSDASDLIDKMLTFNPKKRIGIEQILTHPWLMNVNINNRHNIDLFTIAEKIHLSKYEVDYLNGQREDLIENFTLKNLETINEKTKKHGYTKSYILAPYNSLERRKKYLYSHGINIENNLIKFRGPAKQANIKYELENNKDFDNGMMITKREGETNEEEIEKAIEYDDSFGYSNSFSKCIAPINEIDGYNCLSNDNEEITFNTGVISEKVIKEIEKEVGYNKKYLMDCINNNEINYATAMYFLLLKDVQ